MENLSRVRLFIVVAFALKDTIIIELRKGSASVITCQAKTRPL